MPELFKNNIMKYKIGDKVRLFNNKSAIITKYMTYQIYYAEYRDTNIGFYLF